MEDETFIEKYFTDLLIIKCIQCGGEQSFLPHEITETSVVECCGNKINIYEECAWYFKDAE